MCIYISVGEGVPDQIAYSVTHRFCGQFVIEVVKVGLYFGELCIKYICEVLFNWVLGKVFRLINSPTYVLYLQQSTVSNWILLLLVLLPFLPVLLLVFFDVVATLFEEMISNKISFGSRTHQHQFLCVQRSLLISTFPSWSFQQI